MMKFIFIERQIQRFWCFLIIFVLLVQSFIRNNILKLFFFSQWIELQWGFFSFFSDLISFLISLYFINIKVNFIFFPLLFFYFFFHMTRVEMQPNLFWSFFHMTRIEKQLILRLLRSIFISYLNTRALVLGHGWSSQNKYY